MDISGIKAIVEGANSIITYSIALIGGSLLALLSTNYARPPSRWVKLIYILFLPGWILLGFAIKYGNEVSRSGIMAELNPDLGEKIVAKMNTTYSDEITSFSFALVFLGSWLGLYLLWWVLSDFFKSKDKL